MRIALWLLLFAVIAHSAAAQDRQVVQPPGRVAGLPFSPAVRVGNMLYLSGQLGLVPGTPQLADTGIAGQTRQALENIKALLVYAGSSLDRVVKCTVFLTDMRDFAKMNEVYATYFPKDPPARSTVAGSGLALGARVEIECMATVGELAAAVRSPTRVAATLPTTGTIGRRVERGHSRHHARMTGEQVRPSRRATSTPRASPRSDAKLRSFSSRRSDLYVAST